MIWLLEFSAARKLNGFHTFICLQFCFVVKLKHAVDFVSNCAFCFHDLSFFQRKIAFIKMMQL